MLEIVNCHCSSLLTEDRSYFSWVDWL